MIKNLLVSFSLVILITSRLYGSGHEIRVKIAGLSDVDIILGHHFNESYLPDDTIKLNKNGQGVFKGTEKYPGGMYFLFLPESRLLEFFLDTNQVFSIETDTANLIGNLVFKGCNMNTAWAGFQKQVEERKREAEKLNREKEKAGSAEKGKIDARLKSLGEEFNTLKWQVIENNKDNFLGTFLKATEEIQVPEPPRDDKGNITDSLFQYRYYRNHYFDHFNPSDARLLRTPLYDSKIKRYIEKVVPQVPDTLIKEVDFLVAQSRTSPELFRYMLVTLLNMFARSEIMGMDAVYLHIAERYYITEATWSNDKFIADLKENVEKQKHLVLGKIAPNVQLVFVPSEHFIQASTDTAARSNVHAGAYFNLHDISADYIVLYFWEPDCGHCKKSAPALHELMPVFKELNTVVIGVNMLGGYEGKEKWADFINKNKMYDWMNAWNPYSHDYKLRFDLKASNQIYILNKDKEIVAKRISSDQVERIIKAYKKENEKQHDKSI